MQGKAQPNEGELILRLIARDETAFRDLIRSHHGAMVALARSFVGSRASAEEVAQDTWLAVLAGLAKFERRSSLKSWIFAILINKARSRAAREGRSVALTAEGEDGSDQPWAVDPANFVADGHWRVPPRLWDTLDPERIIAGRQLWQHVSRAIDGLPAAQRAVVILRDVEGHDAEETCRLLGLSEANQRVLLHRGRSRLRAAIDILFL
jgi:RNA polymerase sigma-70 factor, ECF subfamily